MAQKIGRILLCGLTNAGKSTLINKLANYQLALVNPHPQTTRKATQFWYHQEEYSVLFIDTPGYQLNKNKLAYFMNKEIVSNYKKANCVCFLYDLTTNWDQLTVSFLNQLKRKAADKLVVVFTKDDLVAPKKLSSTIDRCYKQISNYLVVQDYFVTNQNDANLLTKLFLKTKRFLTADSDQGFQTTDHDNFVIGEVIRGVGWKLLRQEIPYGLHVEIEDKRYDPTTNLFYIHAYLVCEAQSHKKIIIGNQGQMIKKIGTIAREKLLKLFDTRIYLDLKVKVWPDWRNNEQIVKKQFSHY